MGTLDENLKIIPHRNTFHQLIIAIDFDNTIDDGGFPLVGSIHQYAKEVINKWYAQGAYIIIWTCRTGLSQLEAEAFLLENGVNFHKINEHHPNGLLNYGTERQIEHDLNSRKIWSHILIDDTSVDWVLNGHPGWHKLDQMVQTIIANQLDRRNPWNVQPNYDFSYSVDYQQETVEVLCNLTGENQENCLFVLEDFMAINNITDKLIAHTLIANIENSELEHQLFNGEYGNFSISDSNNFNDCYHDMMEDLFGGS